MILNIIMVSWWLLKSRNTCNNFYWYLPLCLLTGNTLLIFSNIFLLLWWVFLWTWLRFLDRQWQGKCCHVADDLNFGRALSDCNLLRHQSRLNDNLPDDSLKSAGTWNCSYQDAASQQHYAKTIFGGLGFIPGRTTHLKLVLTVSFCYILNAISPLKLSNCCTHTHTHETITEDLFQLKVYMHFMSHCSLFAFVLSSPDALFPPQGICEHACIHQCVFNISKVCTWQESCLDLRIFLFLFTLC